MYDLKDDEGCAIQYKTDFPSLKAHKDAQCYSGQGNPKPYFSTFANQQHKQQHLQPQAHGNLDPGPLVDRGSGSRDGRSRPSNPGTARYSDVSRLGIRGPSPGSAKSLDHKNMISVENGSARTNSGVLV